MNDLPRLLIVSEATLSEDSRGANRTLANLFENYPRDRLMVYAPAEQLKNEPTSTRLASRSNSFKGSFLPPVRNRLGKFINPLITAINLQLLDWLPIENRESLEDFRPEVILICPITTRCLLMGYKVAMYFDCPFAIYFMDDWIATDRTSWLSSGVQKLSDWLLAESTGWLMISEQLQDSLSKRYQIVPQQSEIVHNPVDLSDKQTPDFEISQATTFKVLYAGSIFAMHYDAIAVIAEAIYHLRQEGKDIELVLHTSEKFWQQYQDSWHKWQVTKGGFIPYEQLNQCLQQGNLLLVASSFLPEHKYMTNSSVQTKITDYMASGTPIFASGPNYSACNNFIKKHDCGLVCETNKVSEVKKYLLEQISNQQLNQKYAATAFKVLEEKFEKQRVSQRLYEFIKSLSNNAKKQYNY
ncbi:glycosyltransferase [Myxosarcina sp. GI1]|uniref:glycosyltransferase n=1 Tax=Myxosarcina sp. GI1 TaxID=1541065 RepID=UPI00068CB9E8|nr:glycosyltransferase [Myxosarcina sp. GI1]